MNCVVCECKRLNHLFIKEGQNFTKCPHCGLVSIEAPISIRGTKPYYNKEYYLPWEVNGKLINITKRNKRLTFQLRLNDIEKYSHRGKLLDVGCAMGFFLEAASGRGWDSYGIEVSEYAANIAKGKFGSHVTIGKLENMSFVSESFDVVTMFDVIEHMPVHRETLREILRILKPKGILAISTPNTGSLSCKLMRSAWPHFKAEHIHYFSPRNIKLILNKTGFCILEIKDSEKFLSLSYIKSYFDNYRMTFATKFINSSFIFIPAALRDYPFKIRLGEMLVLARKISQTQ